jgi:hypothetical protein
LIFGSSSLVEVILLSIGVMQRRPDGELIHAMVIASTVLYVRLLCIKIMPEKRPHGTVIFSGLAYILAFLMFPYLHHIIELHEFFVLLISIGVGKILFFFFGLLLGIIKLPKPVTMSETAHVFVNVSHQKAYDTLIYKQTENFWKPHIQKICHVDGGVDKKDFFKVYMEHYSYIVEVTNSISAQCFTLKVSAEEIGVSSQSAYTFTPHPEGVHIKVKTLAKVSDLFSIMIHFLLRPEQEQLLEAKAFLEKKYPSTR